MCHKRWGDDLTLRYCDILRTCSALVCYPLQRGPHLRPQGRHSLHPALPPSTGAGWPRFCQHVPAKPRPTGPGGQGRKGVRGGRPFGLKSGTRCVCVFAWWVPDARFFLSNSSCFFFSRFSSLTLTHDQPVSRLEYNGGQIKRRGVTSSPLPPGGWW